MRKRQVETVPSQLPSGRHGLTRDYVLQSQRGRLLGAAIRVAGSHGYAAMTVTALITHAGVSRKTFYDFFADRESCFLEALDIVLERGVDGARRAYETADAWPERVRAAFSWTLHALAACPHEARIVFTEVLVAGPEALARRDAARAVYAGFVEPGYRATSRRKLPPLLPEAIVGGLSEVIRARVQAGRTAELPALLPELLYCTFAPFLGPADAAAIAGLRATANHRRRAARA